MQLHAGARSLIRSEAADFSLLDSGKSFQGQMLPFVLPYFAYVGLGGMLTSMLGPDLAQGIRFVVVAAILWHYRKSYRFGPRLAGSQALAAVLWAILATVLWVATLRFALSLPFFAKHMAAAGETSFSWLYFALRAANSVLLVPILEELLTRAYIPELVLSRAPGPEKLHILDRRPRPLQAPPLAVRAVAVATFLFTMGHSLPALVPAALYYLLVTALYAWTRSFRACILVHALVNGALAVLVALRPEMKYLWF